MYGQVIEAPPGISAASLGGETMTDLVLSPSSTVINFNDLKIYRIGEGSASHHFSHCSVDMDASESMAPSSALPIGGTRILSEMQPVLIDPSHSGSGLLNAVFALLAPPSPDESERYDEEILDLSVAGFLVM